MVLSLVGITTAVAARTLNRSRESHAARETLRRVAAIVRETQAASLLIGAASGTARVGVLDPTTGAARCPAELAAGRVGLVADTAANSITWVSRVDRVPGASPPSYALGCTTVELGPVTKGLVALEGAPGTILSAASATRYVLQFDGRGGIVGASGPVRALSAVVSGDPPSRQRVLILASGHACLEGASGVCAGEESAR